MGNSSGRLQRLDESELTRLLSNKKILIIGGTSGIGRALAIACLQRGAQVTIVGRRQPDEKLNKATFIQKDLTLMRDANKLVDEIGNSLIESLDILVFTSGIVSAKTREVTSEGIERDMAVSYLSRYAIASRLIKDKKLGTKRSSNTSIKPRVFIMGYPGQNIATEFEDFNSDKSYAMSVAHMRTVVGNEALVTYWADKDPSLNVYGLNPGLIYTEIRDNFLGKGSWLSWIVESIIKLFFPSAEQYANNVLTHLMISPALESKNKFNFASNGSELPRNHFLTIADHQVRIMTESEKLLVRALCSD